MIKISIIIPVYQVEKYIRRCLESVILQDSAPAEIECILVDDCTTDGSMDIVREMISAYKGPIQFVLLQHDVNRGHSVARNYGTWNATGDYVMYVDSDDYLMPDSIAYMVEHLERHPEADMVVGNVICMKDNSLLLSDLKEPWFISDANVFYRRMLHHQIYLYAWNKLIRRSVLTDSNPVEFIDGILYEDRDWSYHLFSLLSSVLLLPKVTYAYENNPTSVLSTTLSADNVDAVLRSYTITINRILDNPPDASRFQHNMTVDYLLFMFSFLMKGVDAQMKHSVSDHIAREFRIVRSRVFFHALKNGRIFVSLFMLQLFTPFCYLQRLRVFRHNYYKLESAVNEYCHLTDFLHRKAIRR